jgi:hypothetical protein
MLPLILIIYAVGGKKSVPGVTSCETTEEVIYKLYSIIESNHTAHSLQKDILSWNTPQI